MALLVVQDGSAGLASVAFQAANAGGDTVPVGARVGGWDLGHYLLVKNGDGSSTTVTVAGVPYVVPATTWFAFIPVVAVHGDGTATKAVTYSAVTALTVGAVRGVPRP